MKKQYEKCMSQFRNDMKCVAMSWFNWYIITIQITESNTTDDFSKKKKIRNGRKSYSLKRLFGRHCSEKSRVHLNITRTGIHCSRTNGLMISTPERCHHLEYF